MVHICNIYFNDSPNSKHRIVVQIIEIQLFAFGKVGQLNHMMCLIVKIVDDINGSVNLIFNSV